MRRGLGNLRTGKELGDIIRAKDPSVVFIAETLTDEARLDRVLQNIDFDKKWVVPKEGRGGGFALFWKASINLTVEDSSKYYIDVCIDKNTEQEWRFTDFYGEPETTTRSEAWDSLCRLNRHPNTPWLGAGDFNELVHWQPPQADVVKINFDGANFSETNTSGIGVVVRDSAGNVLASMSQQLCQAYSAEEIERVAACKALQFASDIGIRVAVLEGDSQILIKRLVESVEVLSYSGALLNDVRRCSSFYNQLCYSHVKREGNKVAHSLAKYAKHISDYVV
ncbi:uncharacterized protein LOC142635397 [Castanea sativa]|uniref:uncharacterized protein LOC142635397 n=1 Tax=Castanea sativa TaxID=21020 RepID=UPI003F64BEB4